MVAIVSFKRLVLNDGVIVVWGTELLTRSNMKKTCLAFDQITLPLGSIVRGELCELAAPMAAPIDGAGSTASENNNEQILDSACI